MLLLLTVRYVTMTSNIERVRDVESIEEKWKYKFERFNSL